MHLSISTLCSPTRLLMQMQTRMVSCRSRIDLPFDATSTRATTAGVASNAGVRRARGLNRDDANESNA